MTAKKSMEYYLRVVKKGDKPDWPKPIDELVVGSQSISDDFEQYWAYPKEEKKDADEMPGAEKVASENSYSRPLMIIDQPDKEEDDLELILAIDGHAWARAESSLDNLENNITSLLDYAKNEFGLSVENFMTTKRVSSKVERAVADLEESVEEEEKEPTLKSKEPVREETVGEKKEEEESLSVHAIDQDSSPSPFQDRGEPASLEPRRSGEDLSYLNHRPSSGSKLIVAIPLLTVIVLFAGVLFFRDQAVEKFKSFPLFTSTQPTPEPTAIPTVEPTPIIEEIDRSQYKVRILNGTATSGAAAKLAASLKDLGWNVVKTGNAETADVKESYIRTTAAAEQTATILVKDLEKSYNATVSTGKIPTSDAVDLEVVIGLK